MIPLQSDHPPPSPTGAGVGHARGLVMGGEVGRVRHRHNTLVVRVLRHLARTIDARPEVLVIRLLPGLSQIPVRQWLCLCSGIGVGFFLYYFHCGLDFTATSNLNPLYHVMICFISRLKQYFFVIRYVKYIF